MKLILIVISLFTFIYTLYINMQFFEKHQPSWEICLQVKKQQLEPDIDQWTGSKLGKAYIKAIYCQPAYLTLCRVYHEKCRAGWSTSWNQDCQEKYQWPQICRWHHPCGRKKEELKSLLMKVKEESGKAGLILNIQKTNIMASSPTTSWQILGKQCKLRDFIFLDSKITADGDYSHKI